MFGLFAIVYAILKNLICLGLADSVKIQNFLLCKFGLWLWVGPLFLALMVGFLNTRKRFGVGLYFLD